MQKQQNSSSWKYNIFKLLGEKFLKQIQSWWNITYLQWQFSDQSGHFLKLTDYNFWTGKWLEISQSIWESDQTGHKTVIAGMLYFTTIWFVSRTFSFSNNVIWKILMNIYMYFADWNSVVQV